MFFFKILEKNSTVYANNALNYSYMVPFNSWNVLKYIFYYNYSNIFSLKKIPSLVVLNNQKNFFNFLTTCYLNKIYVYYITSFFKKNSAKAFNKLHFLYDKSQIQPGVVVILESTLSKSLVSKLTNFKFIFVKPVIDELDFNINIYPIFVNLHDSLHVMMYTSFIKMFLRKTLMFNNLKKQKHYIFLYNKLIKTLNYS